MSNKMVSGAGTQRVNQLQAVPMQRVDTPTAIRRSTPISSPTMPPWLREAVAERKRQLAESRALASSETEIEDRDYAYTTHAEPPSRLTQHHFGIPIEHRSSQHSFVSRWLSSLPEKLTEGWETVLREEIEESFVDEMTANRTTETPQLQAKHHASNNDHDNRRETFFEDINSEEFDFCPGVAHVRNDYQTDEDDEDDDEFLVKVLLGRKRLMQAEISVKRLKMGLKHITSGFCGQFSDDQDAERTKELLTEVDNTFEEVIRKRLSNATAVRQRADNNDEQEQRYRKRLQAMRDRDPGFILRVYTENEMQELQTMVSDILAMDESSGNNEGTDWFWHMLPRLLELRGDMAEAEREFKRQRKAVRQARRKRRSTFSTHLPNIITSTMSVWDLYYHQYMWMQTVLKFRPIGSWYAFSIPVEDEVETADWALRIEQRVWLQEHFSLSLGTIRWTPFRQAGIEL